MSELAIVAGMAKATLPAHPKWRWDDWRDDYSRVRDMIKETYPDNFKDFNARLFQVGGFYRGNPAHERKWATKSGKAILPHRPSCRRSGSAMHPDATACHHAFE